MNIWDRFPNSKRVKKALNLLYAGQEIQTLQKEYYRKKCLLLLGIVLLGAFFTIVLTLQSKSEQRINEGGSIRRRDVGAMDETVLMNVIAENGEKEELSLVLRAKHYSKQEIEDLYEDFLDELIKVVLSDNESVRKVSSPLNLVESLEGYPFYVSWHSSDYEMINVDGSVMYEEEKKDSKVLLTAVIEYETYSWNHVLELQVTKPKLSKKDIWRQEITNAWAKAEKEVEVSEVQLPTEVAGVKVEWREKKENYLGIGVILTSILVVTVFILQDVDLHKKTEERKEQLRKEYPMILHKLLLYFGAGLPVRGAFERVARDYQTTDRKKKEHPIYEEMQWSYGELQTGIPEGTVYENLGKRSGVKEYARLGTLLNQNVKRGSSTLLERLKEENTKAIAENLNEQKQISEKAQTKLLIPMVMMLGIVMVLIMVPAFLGISGNT